MFALIRSLTYVVLALCAANAFFHAKALFPLRRLGAKKRWYAWAASLPAAIVCAVCMRRPFSTAWLACLSANGALLFMDALALFFRALGKGPRVCVARLRGRGLAFLLALLVVAFGLFNMRNVRETRYTLTTNKFSGTLTLALVADTHLGSAMDADAFEETLLRAKNAGAQMLILAGDLTDEGTSMAQFARACAALRDLRMPKGVCFVYGNHDGGRYGGEISAQEMERMLTDAGVTVLTDECLVLDGVLCVAGRKDANDRARMSPEALLAWEDARTEYIVVVDHQPAETRAVAAAGADLLLSGHTHNGQIWPINLISRWFHINEIQYGRARVGGMDAVVTSGAAGWGGAFRTAGRSEYAILTIQGEN